MLAEIETLGAEVIRGRDEINAATKAVCGEFNKIAGKLYIGLIIFEALIAAGQFALGNTALGIMMVCVAAMLAGTYIYMRVKGKK